MQARCEASAQSRQQAASVCTGEVRLLPSDPILQVAAIMRLVVPSPHGPREKKESLVEQVSRRLAVVAMVKVVKQDNRHHLTAFRTFDSFLFHFNSPHPRPCRTGMIMVALQFGAILILPGLL